MIIKEIKNIDPIDCYVNLSGSNYPFILDSSCDHDNFGRYSFAGSDPFMTFKSYNNEIIIVSDGDEKRVIGNPFDELQKLLNLFKRSSGDFPLCSGAVGYFSYDMLHHIETISQKAVEDIKLPHSFFGFYDTLYVCDHKLNKSYALCDDSLLELTKSVAQEKLDEFIRRISVSVAAESSAKVDAKVLKLESNFTRETYYESIKKVLEYIASGDIYQANLSQRFSMDFEGDAASFYRRFVDLSPAPFGALFDIGEAVIMSNSPERYLMKEGDYIQTRPIKGTRPRGSGRQEDERYKSELKESEKDLAEHLMIVDLERNDLGRVSEYGSVKVEDFAAVESYSNVHHLVSTVSGRLKAGVTPIECIKNSFPGGSITGAPKIRAMEIIDELEPTTRSVYTGAIGYFDFCGDFDFNIAIRTAIYVDGKIYFQVGGGIVADSSPESEYEETLVKARSFLRAAGINDSEKLKIKNEKRKGK